MEKKIVDESLDYWTKILIIYNNIIAASNGGLKCALFPLA